MTKGPPKGHRAGLPPPPRAEGRPFSYWTPKEDEVIRQGCEDGLTFDAIADLLGDNRTRGSVAARASRLELRTKTRRLVAEKVKVTKTLIKRGLLKPGRSNVRGKIAARGSVGSRTEAVLPHVTTKQGQLLHVYSREPYALTPLATFEKSGDWWVRRGDPAERYNTAKGAAEHVGLRANL